jgi:hypothetical protein
VASARARHCLALASYTLSWTCDAYCTIEPRKPIMRAPTPLAPGHQDAKSYTIMRVNAPCKHNFTERESSPVSRSSAVCRIPGVCAAQRRASAERRALEQLLCRGV